MFMRSRIVGIRLIGVNGHRVMMGVLVCLERWCTPFPVFMLAVISSGLVPSCSTVGLLTEANINVAGKRERLGRGRESAIKYVDAVIVRHV